MSAIRLDKSKPYGECRGDRTPEDPHYRVAYWQGQNTKVMRNGKQVTAMVVLPFDANGDLVPDDGKKEPWQGQNAESKPTTFHPLWNDDMRALLALKQKRAEKIAAAAEPEEEDELDNPESASEEVNFESWLRGEARYEWPLLVAAAKKRFSRMFTSKKEMVVELVDDEKIVPEDQVCAELRKFLGSKQAA